MLSSHVSLSVSVIRGYCFKKADLRIMQTTLHDSSGSLVFWRQRSSPMGAPNAGEVRWNQELLTNSSLYLKNVTVQQRYRHVITITVEQEAILALPNGDIMNDLCWSLITPNHPIFYILHHRWVEIDTSNLVYRLQVPACWRYIVLVRGMNRWHILNLESPVISLERLKPGSWHFVDR